ncbi:MAG: hypothetical protein A4E49_01371 [Methanosaeta sp. PtaU1.Bin112]|nr:MAG: hypothetical protein A4E49_01371 [Methanosaeta sp. PtaU1.Bin112]
MSWTGWICRIAASLFWEEDEDLPAEASILFDRGLTRIYSTEDVAVLLLAVVQKAIGSRLPNSPSSVLLSR